MVYLRDLVTSTINDAPAEGGAAGEPAAEAPATPGTVDSGDSAESAGASDDTQTEEASAKEATASETPAPPTSMLSEAIQSLTSASQRSHDRLLRTAAELDNFKKRSRRDLKDSVMRAEERIVLEFLPIVDNLERALDHAQEDTGPLVDGVRMVHKQFLSTLERYQIRPFEAVGEPFNPERHEAVQQVSSEHPANTVCHELQRGYMRGDHLVRPSMVVVSKGPSEQEAASDADAAEDGAVGAQPEDG